MQISISNAIKGGGAAASSPAPSFTNINSFLFDGSTDYVDFVNPTGLNFSGSFTLSAWVKTNAIGTSQMIIDTSTSLTNGNGYSIYLHSSGIIRFWSYHTAGLVDSTTVLSASTWYHVACVHDTVSGTNKIYIDGVLENTSSYTHPTTSNTTNLRIGNSSIFASTFDGLIDEVAFFGTDESANINAIGSTIPTDLSTYSPISWLRMGDLATYTGRNWDIPDQGSGGNNGFSDTLPAPPAAPSTDVPI